MPVGTMKTEYTEQEEELGRKISFLEQESIPMAVCPFLI
jgi:hypothetical protein